MAQANESKSEGKSRAASLEDALAKEKAAAQEPRDEGDQTVQEAEAAPEGAMEVMEEATEAITTRRRKIFWKNWPRPAPTTRAWR